jgi:hypothetical protein
VALSNKTKLKKIKNKQKGRHTEEEPDEKKI